jgi:hypothetical protein
MQAAAHTPPCRSAHVTVPDTCRHVPASQVGDGSSDMQLFVATHVRERMVTVGATAGGGGSNNTSSQHVPGVEELVISLEHAFAAAKQGGSDAAPVSRRNSAAIILDHRGRRVRTFASGQPIRLTLGQWLTFSGVALDDVNTRLADCGGDGGGGSGHPGAGGVTYRRTGVDVSLELDYSSDEPSFSKLGSAHDVARWTSLKVRPRLTSLSHVQRSTWAWLQHPVAGMETTKTGVLMRLQVVRRPLCHFWRPF